MTLTEQLAELAALGITPTVTEGAVALAPDQLARVLELGRRNRLDANALRRAMTDIDRGPQPPRFRASELRQYIKTFEHRLHYLTAGIAQQQAGGEERGPLQREFAATTAAVARLNADLNAVTQTES